LEGISVRIFINAAAALVALGMTVPALAAPVASPTPPQGRALLLIPLTLTKVQDLHFGTIIPSTTTAGFVTINAVSGARTASAGIGLVATDVGQRAQFAGAGSAGQKVFLDLTPPVELANPAGDKITVIGMTLDGPALRTIAANQSFFAGVGGTIFINANQPEGLYSATYDLTADYQ
jgi:hypothetical protein